ncbi:hypothetical protein CAPTEDRAFT_218472 [Capitella teleta]|uniref:C-type lectin domain-containing protein n=1 Tax=Capitella teleta TaxID=283909 RepID=R7VJC4_CAPTE|nr:hypothetical protein CAPTEDRAFT_218472 [Capitella teleta]|eukprot:ELU18744.1 hypothetical protein CAPTEDRAFT_218472 [Capitella teleta]
MIMITRQGNENHWLITLTLTTPLMLLIMFGVKLLAVAASLVMTSSPIHCNKDARWKFDIAAKPLDAILLKTCQIGLADCLESLHSYYKRVWRQCFLGECSLLNCAKPKERSLLGSFCGRFCFSRVASDQLCHWSIRLPSKHGLNMSIVALNPWTSNDCTPDRIYIYNAERNVKFRERLPNAYVCDSRSHTFILPNHNEFLLEWKSVSKIDHQVDFFLSYELVRINTLVQKTPLEGYGIDGRGNSTVPGYQLYDEYTKVYYVSWTWASITGKYPHLMLHFLNCSQSVIELVVYDGPSAKTQVLTKLKCNGIKGINIHGTKRHMYLELRMQEKGERQIHFTFVDADMCSRNATQQLCSNLTIEGNFSISHTGESSFYHRWNFFNSNYDGYLRLHLHSMSYEGEQTGHCSYAGLVFMSMPRLKRGGITLCESTHIEPNVENGDIILGSTWNFFHLIVFHYSGLGRLVFRVSVIPYNCPTWINLCIFPSVVRSISYMKPFQGKIGERTFVREGIWYQANKRHKKVFNGEVSHPDFTFDYRRMYANDRKGKLDTWIKITSIKECLVVQTVLQMDQTENNKCSIQFWKEGTGVYTHRNYLVLTPGHIVTNTEDYDCKRDILHLASDAYLLHYLFPCRISVPYIYYILDGVQMRQMVWNYSKDGIDIPVIGVGRTMVKSFDGCGFMDFSRMEFRRSVPIPRLEADADGTMTTKQRSGVIRYPLRDKIRLTLSEFSEQGFASRCCSVYLYIHLELPNPQQMWNITIDGTSRHTTGNMYDGVHLVTVRNVFQWKMSWKSRTLRWKIPGNIVYDPRGLNSILNNMEIKLHSAQLQNDSIGSIMVRFKREVLPLYKGISGNGVGNMGSTELCSTPYGLSGIEYCFPDEEWLGKKGKRISWIDAHLYCREMGWHLAMVRSNVDRDVMNNILDGIFHTSPSSLGRTSEYVIIGLRKKEQYSWSDHSAYNYRFWEEGETYWASSKNITIDAFTVSLNTLRNLQSYENSSGVTKHRNSTDIYIRSSHEPMVGDCVAIRMLDMASQKPWVRIPCDFPLMRSTFVCQNITARQVEDYADASITDVSEYCPSPWVYTNRRCIRLISKTGLSLSENSESLCGSLEGRLMSLQEYFMLAEFVFSFDGWLDNQESTILLRSEEGTCYLVSWSFIYQIWRNVSLSCDHVTPEYQLCEVDPLPTRTACPVAYTKCADGSCLLGQHICDGEADCPTGDDEQGCSECYDEPVFEEWLHFCNCPARKTPLLFRCAKSGQCISLAKVCDCYDDCDDGSDEMCHPTYCGRRRCAVSSQVQAKLTDSLIRFKELDDCLGDDCEETSSMCELPEFIPCSKGSSQCYPRHKTCIYERKSSMEIRYCWSGAHLQNCQHFMCPQMFQCKVPGSTGGYCVPLSHVCDGVEDCPFGRDEFNCTSMNAIYQGALFCKKDLQILHMSAVGDDIVDCPLSRDDEKVCSDFTCHPDCHCEGMVQFCNVTFEEMKDSFHRATVTLFFNTHMKTLPVSVTSLTSLVILSLSYNQLTIVDKTMFSTHTHLQVLLLNANIIRNIEVGAFRANQHLKFLDLSFNQLQKTHTGMFIGLKRLQGLNLSFCDINIIEKGSLDLLLHLEVLDLRSNKINHLPDLFKIDSINLLNLEGNLITVTRRNLIYLSKPTIRRLKVDRANHALRCALKGADVVLEPSVQGECYQLVRYEAMRVILWFLGIGILLNNMASLLWRWPQKGALNLLLLVLSMLNSLSAWHLLAIAIFGSYYSDLFFIYQNEWNGASFCTTMKFVTSIQSDLSMMITLNVLVEKYRGISQKTVSDGVVRIAYVSPGLVGSAIVVALGLIPNHGPVDWMTCDECYGIPEDSSIVSVFVLIYTCLLRIPLLVTIWLMTSFIFVTLRRKMTNVKGRVSGGNSQGRVLAGLLPLAIFNSCPCIMQLVISFNIRHAIVKRKLIYFICVQYIACLFNPINHTLNTKQFKTWINNKIH